MPDLDQALRELLTDERLELPVRRDASRIVQDGVRRRRRRRTIATTTVFATTAGVAVVAALTAPALLTNGADRPSLPTQPHVKYDVAWVGDPQPTPWSPEVKKVPPPSLDAPRCRADQLKVVSADAESGGVGLVFTIIRLRNISSAPCLLVGTPLRVAAQEPGWSDVVATRGLDLGSGGVGGDLQPGHLGYLTVETGRDCAPDSEHSTPIFSSLSVTLPSSTTFSTPVRLNAMCGFRTGGLGVEVLEPKTPIDPRSRLTASMDTSDRLHPGSAAYVVTLTNPTSSAISLRHCPGYVQQLTDGGVSLVESGFALNCASVRTIAPHESVRYQMRINIPVDIMPGQYALRWRLVVAQPVTASTSINVA